MIIIRELCTYSFEIFSDVVEGLLELLVVGIRFEFGGIVFF
jgi:hypothetical protein